MPSEFKFKVPRLYKAATKIVKTVKEQGGDIAELVNQYKKKTNIKALSALAQRVLESEKVLDQIIENTGILKNQKGADPWLYRVLITELLVGKKRLPVGCKPIQTVLAFGPKLTVEHRKLKQGKHVERDAEKSSSDGSDDEESEEELEVPKKKIKKQRNKNSAYIQQSKSSEDQSSSTGAPEEQTTPESSEDIGGEEPKSSTNKAEEYISIKSRDLQAKRGRNLMRPKVKKFMSPKLQNIYKVKQFAKRAHSQTPGGKKFLKGKPRYFEAPSTV